VGPRAHEGGPPTESHHVMARVAHFQELERRYIPGTASDSRAPTASPKRGPTSRGRSGAAARAALMRRHPRSAAAAATTAQRAPCSRCPRCGGAVPHSRQSCSRAPAQGNHGRDIHGRAEDIARQERATRRAERSARGPAVKRRPGQSARRRPPARPRRFDEALHLPEPLRMGRESSGRGARARGGRSGGRPSSPGCRRVPRSRCPPRGRVQAHLAAPHQEACHDQHRLLGDRYPALPRITSAKTAA